MDKSLKTFWLACEKLASAAVMKRWEKEISDKDVLAVARKLLAPMDQPAVQYPCTNEHWCVCSHEVVTHKDGTMVAICTCDDGDCDLIPVTKEDLIVYQMDFSKILGGVARAAGLTMIQPINVDIREPLHFANFDAGGIMIPAYFAMVGSSCLDREKFVSLLIGSYEPFVLFTLSPFDFHINSSNPLSRDSRLMICLADVFTTDGDKIKVASAFGKAVGDFARKALRVANAAEVARPNNEYTIPESVFRQTDGFHNVWIHSKKIRTLSNMQADMVRVLYEAAVKGETELRFAAISSRMEEPPGRFDNVFRADDDRRNVVRMVKRGIFQLNI